MTHDQIVEQPLTEDPVTIFTHEGKVHTAQFIKGAWYIRDLNKIVSAKDIYRWETLHFPHGLEMNIDYYGGKV